MELINQYTCRRAIFISLVIFVACSPKHTSLDKTIREFIRFNQPSDSSNYVVVQFYPWSDSSGMALMELRRFKHDCPPALTRNKFLGASIFIIKSKHGIKTPLSNYTTIEALPSCMRSQYNYDPISIQIIYNFNSNSVQDVLETGESDDFERRLRDIGILEN